jgi:hypothetical protein
VGFFGFSKGAYIGHAVAGGKPTSQGLLHFAQASEINGPCETTLGSRLHQRFKFAMPESKPPFSLTQRTHCYFGG